MEVVEKEETATERPATNTVEIPRELATWIGDYLADRPYKEVASALGALAAHLDK